MAGQGMIRHRQQRCNWQQRKMECITHMGLAEIKDMVEHASLLHAQKPAGVCDWFPSMQPG